MIRFIKTVMIMATLMLLGGCGASGASASAPAVGMVNPLKSYGSIEEMAQAVEFDFLIPAELPAGFELSSCYTVSGKVVSAEYSNGEREILYRTAQASDEYDEAVSISGNYTSFAQKETVQVGDYMVSFSYDAQDTPALALWSGDEMLYSLDGLTMEEAETCILSLAKAEK
ncbi:MAG: hypothetical protein IKD01_06660 [Oscillospiraceae bacterium]|nr:hypothetical protein [Oscillospiraceae bacterium]